MESTIHKFPCRALHVVCVAAPERSRYAICGVRLEHHADGRMAAVATDGRRLLVAEWNGVKSESDWAAVVPAEIIRLIISAAMPDDGRVRDLVIEFTGDAQRVSASIPTEYGTSWVDCDQESGVFPPYRDVLPKLPLKEVSTWVAVNPAGLAGVLTTIKKIAGADQPVKIYAQQSESRPVVLEAWDFDSSIKVTAVVMPANWRDEKAPIASVIEHAVDSAAAPQSSQ